ncbi:hypothetical protein SCMU_36260 [Sinomonas cyclohexanicum]|uniref:L,D-TPase catalytic domain-containing protein n=1 Tax=Sinomonas cyclohexanicum TaxID=322009 RepID=A0ABM7PZP4_SINCY|nr:hypothetical protein SCMU_36260 [Corynebacterium cyclohexanicum]
MSGPIGDAWAAAGGAAGYLGAPVGPETCGQPGNGCFQQFANGYIFYSPTTGAWAVNGAILDRYAATGHNRGFLSYPTGPETCGQPGNGCFQQFANGYIFYSPTTGAWAVNGAILDRYAATGHNRGFLSYPTGPETCGQPGNGCFQQFANGYIFYSPATGAWAVNGAILDRYAATGHNRGFLSYPTGPETCGQPGNGCFQQFANGYIFYSPATGAWAVNGAILDRYASYGHNRGTLGYPTSSETCSGGECLQTFQAGLIGWSGGSTAVYAMSECQTLNDGRSVYGADGSSRVTFAVAEGYAQTRITAVNCFRVAGLFVPQWITDGQVGASGFKAPGVPSGPTRYNYSPSGSYTVTEAFGVGNPGTSLAYTTLNPRSRWGGNPGTDTYNKYFESDSWVGYDENMWYFASRAAHDYRQGAVINYNRPPDSPIIQDAGFAIFLHMNKVPTAGCIALDDWAVVDFLQRSRSGDRIIMGVRSALFR